MMICLTPAQLSCAIVFWTANWPLSSKGATTAEAVPRVKKQRRCLFFVTEHPHHGCAGGDGNFSPRGAKLGWSPRRGADMAVPHVGRKHLQGNAVAARSLCSRLVVRGALPLAEGPLPAQVPCPSPLPGQSVNVSPGASSATGLEGMFHCCQIPGQHQVKWTGRTVAQSLTIT